MNVKQNVICTLIGLVLGGLLGLASVSLAAEEPWVRKADMPTPRDSLSTSVVNGKIYAIGGWNSEPLSTVEEYDPMTDTWTTKADMPTARWGLSTSVVNGKIYAIGGGIGNADTGGGWVPLSAMEEYDPMTDTWTEKADMPTARLYFSTSVVNGVIYAIGGWTNNGAISTMEEYDPMTGIWIKKADMPTLRWALSTSAANGMVYAIGGWLSSEPLSVVEEYNPALEAWTTRTDMPTARAWLATGVVNGVIYAVAGGTGDGATLSAVEGYDPATDIWAKKADITPTRAWLSVSVVNGEIYAVGGWPGAGSFVEEYNWLLSTSYQPQSVDANGKLSTLWGSIKLQNDR